LALTCNRYNWLGFTVPGPEKAGVGGSTPSLATTLNHLK